MVACWALGAGARGLRYLGIALLAVMISWLPPVPAALAQQAIDTAAAHALLYDMSTGTVLLDKKADERMPPASMSKLMTLGLLFEQLKDGRVSLDDTFPVSERAWRKGGSKMFVELGSRVRVEDLIRGITVQSGNDACIVVAEALAGSEEAFAELMNRRAAEIGLTGSRFANSSGWPDPDQYVTARDLARLAERIILEFPQYYKYFSLKEFTYGGIRQENRNPLIFRGEGMADGLKTGHTEESGYGLTASAERNGRRLILVFNGLDSMRARAQEAERLIEWGFREFDTYNLLRADEVVADAEVWLGDMQKLPLVIESDLKVTLRRAARADLKVTVVYDGPIPAPIRKGQSVAKVVVSAPGLQAVEVPLVAGADVGQLGFVGRAGAAIGHLLWGPSG